jgi:isopenicillin-N N-acyltransferase like protein
VASVQLYLKKIYLKENAMFTLQRAVRTVACAALLCLVIAAGAVTEPKVDVAQHGRRTEIGTGDSKLTVLYLKGTPYEIGYAHGSLCAKEVQYFARQVGPLMMLGLGRPRNEVDAIWKGYEKHLRPEYLDELRGLADGSGIPLVEIERISAIPDISEWHCTFFAASAAATKDHDLIQIRALDYETRAGIQKYPALIVVQPNQGTAFVNVGWCGICGMVTGMNAAQIAMSEIGDDWDKDTDDFDGRPLTYVMRDAVQFGRTLDEAVNLVKNGGRTTSLLYCLSDGKTGQQRALKTSHAQCFVYSPADLPFTTKPGLVYMSMGMDSKWNPKCGNWLLEHYGQLDVQTAEEFMQTLHTGSLHAVVMKPATGDLWVANATEKERAYTQPFLHFNLKDALADTFFRH